MSTLGACGVGVGTKSSASTKSSRSMSAALDLSFDIVAWTIGSMGLSPIEFLFSTMLDLRLDLLLLMRAFAFYFVRKHHFEILDRGSWGQIV